MSVDPAMSIELLRNETHAAVQSLEATIDLMWTMFSATIIFFMQSGFSMLEAGSVRERSVGDVLMKNIIDASVGALSWFAIGYMFSADGGSSFIGWPALVNISTPFEAVSAGHGDNHATYFLSYVYAVTAATIVSGAIAERTQQRAYIITSMATTGLIYPVVVHWMWSAHGWLSCTNADAALHGAFDFAGGGVVHLTGGVLALTASATVRAPPSRRPLHWTIARGPCRGPCTTPCTARLYRALQLSSAAFERLRAGGPSARSARQ